MDHPADTMRRRERHGNEFASESEWELLFLFFIGITFIGLFFNLIYEIGNKS